MSGVLSSALVQAQYGTSAPLHPTAQKALCACRKSTSDEGIMHLQDTLGNRKRCESSTRKALQAKQDVVIDRCNADMDQRSHWLNLARYWLHMCQRQFREVPVNILQTRGCSVQMRQHSLSSHLCSMSSRHITICTKLARFLTEFMSGRLA